jgi:hypothetical protein
MEETCSSETSVDIQRITWRYAQEERTLHNHLCENLKSYLLELITFGFITENQPNNYQYIPQVYIKLKSGFIDL